MSLNKDEIINKVETDSRKDVDDSIKGNTSAADNTGLEIRVSRRYDGVGIHGGKECQWCLDRCGENMTLQEAFEKGAFQRHPGCGCEIEYTSAKGKTTYQYEKGGKESWKDIRKYRKLYRLENPTIKQTNHLDPREWFSKDEYEIISNKKLEKYIGEPIIDKDNKSIREWYVSNVVRIPFYIDARSPLEEQAYIAYKSRASYKYMARVAMSDKKVSEMLENEHPEVGFEELLKDKMSRKNISREESLKDIIKSCFKTNKKVNKMFGI